VENLKGKGHLDDQNEDGRKIIKQILKTRFGKVWISSGSGYKPLAGFSDHVNEPSGSMKGGRGVALYTQRAVGFLC
jgi:hypothetical protein